MKLTAGLALLAWLAGLPAMAGGPDNLAVNGGFEKGENGWQWQQWKGRRLPGHVDRDDPYEGRASFKFHDPGVAHELYMAIETRVEGGRDYVLSLALKPQQMPEGAAHVRVLVDGRGWYGRETGRFELVRTGGTHDWQLYKVPIKASALGGVSRLTIFVYHAQPGRGTLGIDAVSLKPGSLPATAPAPATGLKAVTFTSDSPAVLLERSDAAVAIEATPDRVLYRPDGMPRLTVRTAPAPNAALSWRVLNGFGTVLAQHTAPATTETGVTLPPGHGYYEIIATLSRNGQTLGEARRSVGVLPPPAPPAGDEPFGLWIQGQEHYPELGVRWVRDAIDWNSYRAVGDKYFEKRLELYRWYRKHNIRILAYPKGHPRETSREVIEDTPESWKAQEEWWTRIVQKLGDHVDAWGVVNEPMRGHWKGSDALIMRYWALMRRIVDKYDQGKPLVGPSLSPNTPSLVEQYGDLLRMGFGRLIDAVEMHTYVTSPEDNDWEGNTRRIREMTRAAVGRDLPVWSTEHGSSATYQTELLQAQHLMRSWLEAKKIGYPVVIWHMFSHPQGNDPREVQFGIFRNARNTRSATPPQPRPAGLAYGVMTRQLAGATYKATLDWFGPSVRAYVFERNGKAMLALWTTSQKTYDVSLAIGDDTGVSSTGLFGRTVPLAVRDGQVRVTVDRNPQFISPLPAFYLHGEPIARVDTPIEVLPGQSAAATLTLVNPEPRPARFRLEWLPSDGWHVAAPEQAWTLNGHERRRIPLTVTASADLAAGTYQLYARVMRDDVYVASMAAKASVLPQVRFDDIAPRIVDGRPALAGTLRRLDPQLATATVRLEAGKTTTTVTFDAGDQMPFVLPVDSPPPGRLGDFALVAHASDPRRSVKETVRASFVHARHAAEKPAIDGALDDWPDMVDAGGFDVAWRWDAQNLYLAVRVKDATHIQREAATEMWKDDSLQIGLAPGHPDQLVRAFLPGLQETDMVELDVALNHDAATLYRHLTVNKHIAPAGSVEPGQLRRAVRHAEGVTTYELQIPVAQAGLKPLQAGQVLRVSLLLNDNDGSRRQTTEWFGGIKEAKDPNLFGHLILAP